MLVVGDTEHHVTLRAGPDFRRTGGRSALQSFGPFREIVLAVWTHWHMFTHGSQRHEPCGHRSRHSKYRHRW